MPRPRPILKSPPDSYLWSCQPQSNTLPFPYSRPTNVLRSPHVHFPPTPTLSSTHKAYSPNSYDRAPIIVSPNSGALKLPERGGRVYTPPGSSSMSSAPVKGSYFHPRAYEACEREVLDEDPPSQFAPPPPLIPDFPGSSSSSSDFSDESDGYGSPQLLSPMPPMHMSPDTTYPIMPHTHLREDLGHALSFLPYSPSAAKGRDLNDRPKKKRRRESPAPTRRGWNERVTVTNAHDSYDGMEDSCLGGF